MSVILQGKSRTAFGLPSSETCSCLPQDRGWDTSPHLPRLSILPRWGSPSSPLLPTHPSRNWSLGKRAQLFFQRQANHSLLSTQQLNSRANLQALNIYVGFPGSMSRWLGPPGPCKYSPFSSTSHLSRILQFGYSFFIVNSYEHRSNSCFQL